MADHKQWGQLAPTFTYRLDQSASRHPLVRERESLRQPAHTQTVESQPRQPTRRYMRQIYRNRVRYADGLGDRDRSLSPEGDGVWDTLQSTLTPDPQPPSIGSSFASTTVSAATSHGTSANLSTNTSVTSPDGEAEAEPPCDHEFDDDEEDGPESEDGDDVAAAAAVMAAVTAAERHTGPSRRSMPLSSDRRSYADFMANLMFDATPPPPPQRDDGGNGSGGGDRPEWLSGMHRIVRGLASRQDIPDEWWAEAGLSRSMRYEDS